MIGKIIKNKRGISLIETVVYTAVFFIFVMAVFNIANIINRIEQQNNNSFSVNTYILPTLNQISDNIKNKGLSDHFTYSKPNNSITLSDDTSYFLSSNCYSNGNNCIKLRVKEGANYSDKILTPENINISQLDFYISEGDNFSIPIITTILSGTVKKRNTTDFSFQNTIEIKKYIYEK